MGQAIHLGIVERTGAFLTNKIAAWLGGATSESGRYSHLIQCDLPSTPLRLYGLFGLWGTAPYAYGFPPVGDDESPVDSRMIQLNQIQDEKDAILLVPLAHGFSAYVAGGRHSGCDCC